MCKEVGFMAGTTLAQQRRERLFLPLQFGKGEPVAESLRQEHLCPKDESSTFV